MSDYLQTKMHQNRFWMSLQRCHKPPRIKGLLLGEGMGGEGWGSEKRVHRLLLLWDPRMVNLTLNALNIYVY